MSRFYQQNDIMCAITALNKEKLELYLNLYGERIITMEIMNYALLYGDIHTLILLHHYVNQVFDIETLKKLDKTDANNRQKIKFIKTHYGGVKNYL